VRLEVIVIDDGSTDETAAVVARTFGHDPRVTLLRLDNGGKARALNHALALAKADVVIALDADTRFEPDTIARLAAWFADPAIGAVAGNARIGNRVNLLTRWQAVEYVTAQALERRALDALGAVTVVPGAVGAWRRAALDEVGGYPTDTLAEDQDLTIAIQRAGWRVACDPWPWPGPRRPKPSPRCGGSAIAGRSAPCNACGSIAACCGTASRAAWRGSACRRPGCSRSCSGSFPR
jgi:cellulose synthase/poly-beta-1,6-N-acetylglucosamine synthase-like glycosyltransferase